MDMEGDHMVLIDQMDMPRSCERCRFSMLKKDDLYCLAREHVTLIYENDWDIRRSRRCPLEEIGNDEYICEGCGMGLKRTWNWCPWCRLEINRTF